MSFTAKNYTETARIIANARATFHDCGGGDDGAHSALRIVQDGIRRMFAADNPRFDAARFDMACEPKVKPGTCPKCKSTNIETTIQGESCCHDCGAEWEGTK